VSYVCELIVDLVGGVGQLNQLISIGPGSY